MTPQPWLPRPYQKEGVRLCIQQACAGLLMDPGLGKTSVMYAVIRILRDQGLIKKVLVVCPLRPAYNVWPVQRATYTDFVNLRVAVLHGADKERVLRDEADIYVINPEGLQWLFDAKVEIVNKKHKVTLNPERMAFLAQKFDMLVVDESTKFRTPQSIRFMLLKKALHLFKRRYILTGTPAPKGLMDLWGQIYLLDEGLALGSYITHYRQRYFYPAGWGGHGWEPKDNAAVAVAEAINPLVLRVSAAGNVDLPEVIYDDIWVNLDAEALAAYKDMQDKLIVRMAEDPIFAANAGVASSKCRQIANGAIYDNGTAGLWQQIHDEKLDAVGDLLEQLQGNPVLITYEFEFDRDRLERKYGIPCISTGNARRDNELIQKFSRGELPAVMGNPASISLGLDGMQHACHHICMVGCTWNLLDYQQVIDRVRRSGSRSNHVVIHRILARVPIDERVIEVLNDRDATQQGFLKLLQTLRQ